jgi:hypothetical protein
MGQAMNVLPFEKQVQIISALRPFAFGSGRAYNIGMKFRHAAALALGISGCGSRVSPGWSFLDWFGLCLIFLVVAIVVIGLVGLAKSIRD